VTSMLLRKINKPSGKCHSYYRGWMSATAELWRYYKDKPGKFKRVGLDAEMRVKNFRMRTKKR
jgi:hypothetical protein